MKRCFGCFSIVESDNQISCNICGFSVNSKIEGFYLHPGCKLYNERYIIGNVLGRGGFGITYLAWDTISEKKVSIKEYFPSEFSSRSSNNTSLSVYSGSGDKSFREGLSRFIDEAQRLAKLVYIDGIIKIHECFEENNTAYIVMEYLEGESLAVKLERDKKIEPDVAINMMLPIMKSLIKIHREGIIHRDISPDNIFVLNDGTARLLDFGAARQALAEESKSLTVIVKAGYSPEEQYASNGKQGTWTDVYSMAATIYRMITGEKPIDAITRSRSVYVEKKDSLIGIDEYGLKIEKNIISAIKNALEIDYGKRTNNFETFVRELSGEKDSLKDRKKIKVNKKVIISIGVLSVMVTIMFCFIFNKQNKPNTDVSKKSTDVIKENKEVQVKMPSLLNMNVNEIDSILDNIGLNYNITSYEEREDIEENIVLSQSIEPDTFINEATTVELSVSCRKKEIVIPNVLNKTENDARIELEALGLTVQIISSEEDEEDVRVVTSQTPETGTIASNGCIVILKTAKVGVEKTNNSTESTSVKKNSNNSNNNVTTKTASPISDNSSQNENMQENNSNNTEASKIDTETSTRKETPSSSFTYIVSGGTVSISGYNGSDSHVIIPYTIDNYPVVGIAGEAFEGNKTIKSIDFGKVTSIGTEAFSGSSITTVTIPSTVTYLGWRAFLDCKLLTSVTINSSIDVSPYSFSGCETLSTVILANGVTSIGFETFTNCKSITSIIVPDSVKSIGINAFMFCINLSTVKIGNGVTKIEQGAFSKCDVLKSVDIGNSLTALDTMVFFNDQKLEKIVLPSSLTSISSGNFYQCKALKTVYYRGTKEQWDKLIGSTQTLNNEPLFSADIIFNY